jgi:hypothetical protein
MPTVSPGKTTNPIDPNALSLDRIRRNFQRLSQGVNGLIALNPDGGLIDQGGLAVAVDGTTIVIIDNQLVATAGSAQNVMARISLGV